MMTAAQAMVQALQNEGVSTVFGYPGATILPFYDCLLQSDIRHVLVRQEQNAGHAANGYARITGKPGVCVCTSGPGATNLITALATAYMDSVPLVAITGQVPSHLLGHDVFQEADITGAAESFTKYSYLVKDASQLPRIVKEAFYIAGSGRRGPVLIDVPVDVQLQEIEFGCPANVSIRGYKPSVKGNAVQLRRVAAALQESERPLICAGGGVLAARAKRQLAALAEGCNIPVVCTMMGLGALPTAHPLYLGMVGSYGADAANEALRRADLLLVVGARVGDRAMGSLGQAAQVVHIDVDPAEIGKNVSTHIPLVGDARQVLGQLIETQTQPKAEGWPRQLRELKAAQPQPQPHESSVTPALFIRALSDALPDDAVVTADVGQNQIWTANHLELRTGSFLTSGGMGTMGYSIPAAAGAKLAAPSRTVVAVCGDGSFQMMLPELATLVENDIDVKLVVMRNHRLGMIRELQDAGYGGRRFAVELGRTPDIPALCAAYGIPAQRLESDSNAEAAIAALLAVRGSALLECIVDADEPSTGGRAI